MVFGADAFCLTFQAVGQHPFRSINWRLSLTCYAAVYAGIGLLRQHICASLTAKRLSLRKQCSADVIFMAWLFLVSKSASMYLQMRAPMVVIIDVCTAAQFN